MFLTSSGWFAEFPTPSSATWSHSCGLTDELLEMGGKAVVAISQCNSG